MTHKARNATGDEDDRDAAPSLAAIVFDRDEEPDPPLIAFLESAARRAVRIAGLVQEHANVGACDVHDAQVRDLVTGETLPIMQDLGRGATGCGSIPRPSRPPRSYWTSRAKAPPSFSSPTGSGASSPRAAA